MEKLLNDDLPPKNAVISFYDDSYDKAGAKIDYAGKADRVFYIEISDIEQIGKQNMLFDTYLPEADELAGFIYRAKIDGWDIICQCDGGQSRSAACAAAILEHFYHKGNLVFENSRYMPNETIFNKIFDALERMKKAE